MKKKYGVIIISTLILVVSLTLIINKPSYAAHSSSTTDYCPDQIIINGGGNQEILPGMSLQLLGATLPTGEPLNNTVLSQYRLNTALGTTIPKSNETILPIIKFSNNAMENWYYSQLFLWWTWDVEANDDFYLLKEEKEAIASSEAGKKVAEKIEGYKKYINSPVGFTPSIDNIDMSNITYHVTNDYIETNLITPNCSKDYTFIFTDYEVKTTSPVIVVDEKGKEKTSFQKGEGFKLRIPISEIKNNEINFQAEIIGKSTFDIWSQYYTSEVVNRGTASNIYLINCGKSKSEDAFESININYSIEVGTLNIKVIDAESKKELKDAEVVIYDKSGNIVYRYKTTGSTLNITLPVGEYTVKQIITPPNYQARVVEQKVTVTENGETDAVLENVQLLEVPDTNKTAGILPIIGLIILIGGMLTITIMLKKMRYTKGR